MPSLPIISLSLFISLNISRDQCIICSACISRHQCIRSACQRLLVTVLRSMYRVLCQGAHEIIQLFLGHVSKVPFWPIIFYLGPACHIFIFNQILISRCKIALT